MTPAKVEFINQFYGTRYGQLFIVSLSLIIIYRRPVSSVGRAPLCRAGGRGFKQPGPTDEMILAPFYADVQAYC